MAEQADPVILFLILSGVAIIYMILVLGLASIREAVATGFSQLQEKIDSREREASPEKLV
jgi:hypothetical protein